MLGYYPANYMISSGRGKAKDELVAFDCALIDAGIANYNLVRVSSILPAGCAQMPKVSLKEGSPLLVAYGCASSDEPGATISSAVCAAVPENDGEVGLIMEHSGSCSAEEADRKVRKMAEEAMGNHGITCKELRSSSIEATVPEDGYVSVISAVAMW